MTDKEITLKNLRRVYEELPKIAEQNPEIIQEFDMDFYGCYNYSEIEKPICKTQGCSLGNFPRVITEALKDKRCYNDHGYFDYDLFCNIYFPSISINDNHWDFLFSGHWSQFQPTFEQAMQRVKYYLDHDGYIPIWYYQKEPFIKA